MSLSWKLNRLRAMSARELRHRGRRFARNWAQSRGFGLIRPAEPSGRSGAAWVTPLPRGFEAEPYVRAAERCIEGRYRIFALEDDALGFPPAWNRDPKTGLQAPMRFGSSLNYRDARLCGDAKYVWELNRHAELVTLAQAWHLTGRQRYADACRTMLDSWFDQCPYPNGVNWCSSLELAIRLTNWSFAWHLLGGDESPVFDGVSGASLKAAWLGAVRQHCGFIAGNFSEFSSANNHLFGELMGLFVGAVTWPLWPECEFWRETARRRLVEESANQIWGDGVSKEQSTWYHHEVADMMLLVILVGRANAQPFSGEFHDRLAAMLEFIAAVMDVAGHVPAFGDADDAVIARISPTRNGAVYRSVLATGAVVFERGDFARRAGPRDDCTRWLLGDSADARLAALSRDPERGPVRRAFPQAGYYVLGDALDTKREIRIVADAGSLGYLSIAAHGHADALSFTLSAGGRELLIDAGTYAYHTAEAWRAYFRGTAAHNTIRVDGRDQSVSGGSFLWLTHATSRVEEYAIDPNIERLTAWHDGYARLRDPVRHRRRWVLDRERQALTVTDELFCTRSHQIEVFWHFAEDCTVECVGGQVTASSGNVILTMTVPPGLERMLLHGTTSPISGWRSRDLDRKEPCSTLVLSGRIRGDARFVTSMDIAFDDR